MEEFDKEITDVPLYKKTWFIATVAASVVAIILIISLSVALTRNKENNEEVTNEDTEKPSKLMSGGWMYRIHKKSAEYNTKWAKEQGWNFAFVTTNAGYESGKKLLKQHAEEFAKQGLAYHAMTLEDQDYHTNPDKGVEEVQAILDYCESENIKIAGIHIDYEPHALDEWEDQKQELMDGYRTLVKRISPIVKAKNLVFSAAVPWWWPALSKNGELENTRGYDLVNKDMLDMVALMLYDGAGNTAEDIISHAKQYLDDKVPTL